MKLWERVDYSAIVDRPPLRLPGGKAVAVWPLVTVEVWDPDGPMPRTVLTPPQGASFIPDVPNWSWAEYGVRVGFWRMKAALDERGLKANFCINASVIERYPRVCEAALEVGWEFMGHNIVQKPMHAMDDEAAAIEGSVAAILKTTRERTRFGHRAGAKFARSQNEWRSAISPPHRSLSAADVELISRETPFSRYSRLHVLHLRHRLHGGGWSREIEREVLERIPCAAVLPYDPVRDEVVLVEQFRPGAYASSIDCFQLEPVAGAIEDGQEPIAVARREAREEAGCEIRAFEPICTFTVSPGYSTEIVHAWCGWVDAAGIGGVHGQAHEDEDIKVHVLAYQEAQARLAAGRFQYALTVISLQWLALNRDRLRRLWSGQTG